MQKFKLPIIGLIIISVFVVNLSYKNFQSYLLQIDLKNDIMTNSYDRPLEFISKIDYNYPSLTNTTIPIKSIVGRYYYEMDSIDRGINLLKEGAKDNPYIMFSESLLADIYDQEKERDSFLKYSNKAFKKLPNNPIHFVMYSRKLKSENKIDSIIYHFNKIIGNASYADYQVWKVVLAALVENQDTSLIDKKNKILKEFDKIKEVGKNEFKRDDIGLLADYVRYGSAQVKVAQSLHDNALTFFNEGKVDESIEILEKSIELYPAKRSYENLIKVFFLSEQFKKVTSIYDDYSLKFKESDVITMSYYALSLFNEGNYQKACSVANHIQLYSDLMLPNELSEKCI